MGWRLKNVPTRCSVADALIARRAGPGASPAGRLRAPSRLSTSPRLTAAVRSGRTRNDLAWRHHRLRARASGKPCPTRRPDRGLDGTGDRGARTKPEPTASYLPPSDFWRVAVPRRTSRNHLILLV